MTAYIPYFPVSLVGPGRFFLVPRFGASVVLSVPGQSKPVEVAYGTAAWLPVQADQTVQVISGYVEVVQFSRRLDAEPEHVPFREELTTGESS